MSLRTSQQTSERNFFRVDVRCATGHAPTHATLRGAPHETLSWRSARQYARRRTVRAVTHCSSRLPLPPPGPASRSRRRLYRVVKPAEFDGEGGRRDAAMAEANPLRGFPRLRRAAVRGMLWERGGRDAAALRDEGEMRRER